MTKLSESAERALAYLDAKFREGVPFEIHIVSLQGGVKDFIEVRRPLLPEPSGDTASLTRTKRAR